VDITEEVTCRGHGHHVGGDRLDFLEYNNLFLDYPKIGRDNEGRIESYTCPRIRTNVKKKKQKRLRSMALFGKGMRCNGS
jgi:hypothetical protein